MKLLVTAELKLYGVDREELVYHPTNLLFVFTGSAGLPTLSPYVTVLDGTADPPLLLKDTVYVFILYPAVMVRLLVTFV